jgi:hypothetical protein
MRGCAHPPYALGAFLRERVGNTVASAEANLFRFLGHLAQFDRLVRGHVNLLASFANEKRSAIRGSKIS